MKLCLKCNLEYDDKFSFCKKCGSRLINDMNNKSLEGLKNNFQNNYDYNCRSKNVDYSLFLFCTILLIIFVPIVIYIVGLSAKSNPTAIYQSDNVVNNMSVVQPKKMAIPDSFERVNILGRNIYLPKEFKRITEEEKILYSSPSEHETVGIALYGLVDYNLPNQNDSLKRYEVTIAYGYSPAFHNLQPSVEEKSLEENFKGVRFNASQTSNFELISKEFCKNVNGHKCLKAKYIVSDKNNLDEKIVVHYFSTFFDDKIYAIFLKSYVGTQGNFDNEFDIIFNTFGYN